MFDPSFRGAILLLLGIATTAPAHADGPKAGFKLNAEETVAAPDQSLRVEQYSKELKDQAVLNQFWTFDRDQRHPSLLNPGENDELAGYPAGFRFSPDSQWLVRMQKLGAGSHAVPVSAAGKSLHGRNEKTVWRPRLGLFLRLAGLLEHAS